MAQSRYLFLLIVCVSWGNCGNCREKGNKKRTLFYWLANNFLNELRIHRSMDIVLQIIKEESSILRTIKRRKDN